MQLGREKICVVSTILLWAALCGAQEFVVSDMPNHDIQLSSAYNMTNDEFLVVWRYAENPSNWGGDGDIYGRIIYSDGTPVTNPFPIIVNENLQLQPDVDFNRLRNEYLVVFQNLAAGTNHIYGMRLDADGNKLVSEGSLSDTSFVISDYPTCKYRPRVAHNYTDDTYFVVWEDSRNYTQMDNSDIYGQRLAWDGALLTPDDPTGTQVNMPVSVGGVNYSDYEPDIAYHGSAGTELNEWLVVFTRYTANHVARVWGVRVRGWDGALLNTYGVAEQIYDAQAPWYPQFPVSHDGKSLMGTDAVGHYCAHVASNAEWSSGIGKVQSNYTLPEFLVAWTDFRNGSSNPDIYCQRVAYFADADAVSMGLKPSAGTEDLFTAVLLDQSGDPPATPSDWITWANYPATSHSKYQSWNNLAYNQTSGEYLVVWNDWRETDFDGTQSPASAADIYGQRLWLNPADSSLVWLDDAGQGGADPAVNIPIKNERTPDEGNQNYPAPAFGTVTNEFFVPYAYDALADNNTSDIRAVFYAGSAPSAVGEDIAAFQPEGYLTAWNAPNPFNPATTITFHLPETAETSVQVFDASGREIGTLLDCHLGPGEHRVRWEATDAGGRRLPSGVYFFRVEAGRFLLTQKMLLVR